MSTATLDWMAKSQFNRLDSVPMDSPEFQKGLAKFGGSSEKAVKEIIGGDFVTIGAPSNTHGFLYHRWANTICNKCKDTTFQGNEGKRLSLCSGCCKRFYCSDECQLQDWDCHSKECGSESLPDLIVSS